MQYILLPFLLNGSFLATLVGNTLYLAAFVVYFYISFYGYTGACQPPAACLLIATSRQPCV